jgi:hypothetical protein
MGLKDWNPIEAMGIGEKKHLGRATGIEISMAMSLTLKDFIFSPYDTDEAPIRDMKLKLRELFLRHLNLSLQRHGEIAIFDEEDGLVIKTQPFHKE